MSSIVLINATSNEMPVADESVHLKQDLTKFIEGGKKTRFQKGHHWRPRRPYWQREWLHNEYVIKGRSSAEIASEFGITDSAILFWLGKHGIEARTVSEARDLKHWGCSGESNPMYSKRGELNQNWKGGITPERQAIYGRFEWRNIAKQVWDRDKGICQRCRQFFGSENKRKIHIHHIVPFSDASQRMNPDKLVLLCAKCHRFVHSDKNINAEFIVKGG